MKSLFIIIALSPLLMFSCRAPEHEELHSSLAENPEHLRLATGELDISQRITLGERRYDWPFEPKAIGHTMASYQNYGNDPYFHHGLDIVGQSGQVVRASVGGKVVDIRNYMPGRAAYWEVAILDADGYIWQYHHVDRASIPPEVVRAFESGGTINTGDIVGRIFHWSQPMANEPYHHVHLNVIAKDGVYVNPFAFLKPLADQTKPVIHDIGILQNGRKAQGQTARAGYSLYAEASDVVLGSPFKVPPYALSFQVNGGDIIDVWTFNTLPGKSSRREHLNSLYVRGETCGNYTCRKHTYDLSFDLDGTSPLPNYNGEHTVKVMAKDFAGNQVEREFRYRVDGASGSPPAPVRKLKVALGEVSGSLVGYVSTPPAVASVRLCPGTWQSCQNRHTSLSASSKSTLRSSGRRVFEALPIALTEDRTPLTIISLSQSGQLIEHREILIIRTN